MPDFSRIEAVVHEALGRVFPAAQLEVRSRGEVLLSRAYGWLDPAARRRPTQQDTLFDLASLTKLFVVTAFMTLVEAGHAGLDQPVSSILADFDGPRPIRPYEDPLRPGEFVTVSAATREPVDAGRVTFRNLLAHNSGLPAWRPLYLEGSPEAARRLALTTAFAYPIGARVVYSDIGLVLLGMAIERLAGPPLEAAVRRRVIEPLGLAHTRYLPIAAPADLPSPGPGEGESGINVAPTEVCAWRGRRLVGEVHDENAAGLGGVAGHAGLFSTAQDVAAFGQAYLAMLAGQRPARGIAVLRPATVAEMIRLQAQDGALRRGLGFALWSPDPENSGNPFSETAFGHTGFTGTSLWIDPARALVVAAMTNRVYYGRDARGILEFRIALHGAILESLRG